MEAQAQNSNARRQGQVGGGEVINGGISAAMDTGDWRNRLTADSRERIVGRIMGTLARHLTFTGQEGMQEVREIAVRFEEKIFTNATSESEYLRRISVKMLIMEMDTQKQNPQQFNGANAGQNPSDQGEAAARSNPRYQSNEGSGKRLRLNEGGAHSVSTYESPHDSEGPHIPVPRPVSVTVAKDQVKRKGKTTTPEVMADHEREKLKLKQLELEEKALGRKEKMLKRKNKMLICLINLGEKVTPQQAVIRDKLMAELYEAEP